MHKVRADRGIVGLARHGAAVVRPARRELGTVAGPLLKAGVGQQVTAGGFRRQQRAAAVFLGAARVDVAIKENFAPVALLVARQIDRDVGDGTGALQPHLVKPDRPHRIDAGNRRDLQPQPSAGQGLGCLTVHGHPLAFDHRTVVGGAGGRPARVDDGHRGPAKLQGTIEARRQRVGKISRHGVGQWIRLGQKLRARAVRIHAGGKRAGRGLIAHAGRALPQCRTSRDIAGVPVSGKGD